MKIRYILLLALTLCLAIFILQISKSKSIMDLLGSDDWSELTQISTVLSTSMELPDRPPELPDEILAEQVSTVEINYENEALFYDSQQDQRILPYLGHILELNNLTPLEPFPEQQDQGISKVFEASVGSEKVYVCIFTDGDYQRVIAYDKMGKKIGLLEQTHQAASCFGKHLVLHIDNNFHMYELTAEGINPMAILPTAAIARYIQKMAPKAQDSDVFQFSDFKFQFIDGRLTIWAFNIATTAFMPEFLHLKATYETLDSLPKIDTVFGVATKADRLPLNTRSYRVARVGNHFWVPRNNDAQIDIYNLDGGLVKTVVMAPIVQSISSGGVLSSEIILRLALENKDPEIFYKHYTAKNPISAVDQVGDFILVSRANYQNLRYQMIYTLLSQNGDVLTEDFCSNDMMPLGSGSSGVLSLTRFNADAAYQPKWLLDSEMLNLEDIRGHNAWWLSGFTIRKRVGYNPIRTAPPSTPSSKAAETESVSISPKLKKNLLKAKQFRNILVFKGFLELHVPEQFALKDMTDVLFMDNHYFVVDGPGKQFLKFDEHGEFVEPMSHQGEGPGEFQRPFAVNRAFNHHLVLESSHATQLFHTNGTLVRELKGGKDVGLALGGGNVIWEDPNIVFVSDALPASSGHYHVRLDLGPGRKMTHKGFGDRFRLYDQQFALRFGEYNIDAFAKIGNTIWTGSPYNASLVLYDLDGNYLKELKSSYYPNGITYADFQKIPPNIEKKKFREFYLQKIGNSAIHKLGPVVIRVLRHPIQTPYVYDVYSQEGKLLAKGLKPGASTIKILDTSNGTLIGKISGLDQVGWTEETIKKFLYKPELDALMAAGFRYGINEDHQYLWLGGLAE